MMVAAGLTACSKKTAEEQAMAAAQECYTQLLEGHYEDFLDGRAGMDSIPDSFREQLLVAYKQFAHQQGSAHEGWVNVEATRARMDSTLRLMQVYLLVSYADSTQEEIVVPMVERDGEWKMK